MASAPDVQAPTPDVPEPDVPEPDVPDEPKLDVPEPDVPEPDVPRTKPIDHCKIVLGGRGPEIERAVVKADSGLHGSTVDRGRTVGYGCPEPADRTHVDVIAKLENDKTVHWSNVVIDAEGEGTIESSDSRRGYPDGLTPEQRRQLEKDFEIPPGDRVPPASPTPSRVTFMPHQFPWAEITLGTRGKRPQVYVLDGMRQAKLLPARYTVSFREEPDGPVRRAGTDLVVEAGKSYTVKLLKRAPHLSITVR